MHISEFAGSAKAIQRARLTLSLEPRTAILGRYAVFLNDATIWATWLCVLEV